MTSAARARTAATAPALIAAVLAALAACAPSGEKLLARAEQQLAGGEYRGAMIDLRNYLAVTLGDPPGRD